MTSAIDEPASNATSRPEGRAWYMLALLVLIYIVGSIDRAVPLVIVEPLKKEFGLSDGQIGFITGFAYSVPYALAALPGGWLLDRFDRRALLAAAIGLWSLMTAVGGVAQSYLTLVLARVGVGALEAPASPGSLSLISDLFPPARRGGAITLYYAGTAVAQLLTFLVGGWLLLHFGWRTLFFIAAAPGLVLAALLMFTCREPARGRFDEGGKPQPAVSYRQALQAIGASPPLRHSIVGNMVSTGVNYAILVWTVSFLSRVHHISHEYAAMAVGVGIGAMMVVGALTAGFVIERFVGENRARLALVPACATAMTGLAGVAMCLMPSQPLVLASLGTLGFFMGANTGPGYATLVSQTGANMRASVLSLAKIASILIGNGVLAYATGKLSDVIGGAESIRWALLITVLVIFWATLEFAAVARGQRQADDRRDV